MALVIQGAFCYLLEYFCANYFMNNGYGLTNAGASGAPIGDMMVIAGTWFFGSYSAGRAFMLVQALTMKLVTEQGIPQDAASIAMTLLQPGVDIPQTIIEIETLIKQGG